MPAGRAWMRIPAGVSLPVLVGALIVLLFQVLRLCFYIRNHDLAGGAGAGVVAGAFLRGLRFDAAVAAYALVLLLIAAKAARLLKGTAGERAAYLGGAAALGAFFVIGGLAECEFYREFYSRYNMLAVQYWSHGGTVASMIWHGYPVVRYLLLGALLTAGYVLVLRQLARLAAPRARPSEARAAEGAPAVEGRAARAAKGVPAVAAREARADGAAERGPAERGAAERGAAERGAAERGAAERGPAERGAVERGAAERGAAERSAAERGAARVRGPRWVVALAEALLMLPLIALVFVAARGGVRGTPLQWGDATFSESTFANALALNGFWTLGSALASARAHGRTDQEWLRSLPGVEARERVRRLLFLPGDQRVFPPGQQQLARGGNDQVLRPGSGPDGMARDSERFPLLRRQGGSPRSLSLARLAVGGAPARSASPVAAPSPPSAAPPNVVVIIMESFSARYVGAVGSNNNRTPEFNRLAANGVLFDRCFSNGSHTDQAAYCVTTGFPNLPGHESLMQTVLAAQPFDSLPAALRRRGYRTFFIYNGDPTWDNMQGFFRSQGTDTIIGRDDFAASARLDVTWGVSDKELFERAHEEFARAKGPFYATILTLSNHTPFDLPRPLPFPEITDAGGSDERMNGIRFADWSIGHFFELARQSAYFRNTLFVMVGDHGFSVPPVMSEINLLRFHVPLLFYAPALLGAEARTRHTVASHVDIVPTILGLLGDSAPHQHWGRDLFALPEGDPGFAVFKPAGNAPEVGFARGNTLLVESAGGGKRLYRYDLGFPPGLEAYDSAAGGPGQDRHVPSRENLHHRGGDRAAILPRALLHEMDRDMRAYIQTALEALEGRRIAPE